jgi:hypothetical protein
MNALRRPAASFRHSAATRRQGGADTVSKIPRIITTILQRGFVGRTTMAHPAPRP